MLARVVACSREFQAEGRLRDPASRAEVAMLERYLRRLERTYMGDKVVTLTPASPSDDAQQVVAESRRLRQASAVTRAASGQLRKQIMRRRLVEGEGTAS